MSSNINNDMKHALADTGVGIFAFTSLDDVAFAAKLLSDYNLLQVLYIKILTINVIIFH